MSYGKMNKFAEILTTVPTKDAEGFTNPGDTVVATIRVYRVRSGTATKNGRTWRRSATPPLFSVSAKSPA
jgi:hypothetical protein